MRAPSPVPVDDAVLPFEVDALDLRGRLTRLGPALDELLDKHDYPAPVGKLLGEAIVLTTLLGSSLKFDGRFILQTQTDGPVSFLIVDFQAPDRLRAYARFDAKRLRPGLDSGALLGQGPSRHDHRSGPGHEPLSRAGGAARAAAWKTPRMNIFCARSRSRHECGSRSARNGAAARAAKTPLARRRHAAAIPPQGAGARAAARSAIRATRRKARVAHMVAEDDAWVEGQSLISTVEDVELIDPDLSGERLLYGYFTNAASASSPRCRCARNAPARATRSQRCSRASRRKTAPRW